MPKDRVRTAGRLLVYRHGLIVRLTHWVNVVCLGVLLLSGLQILCSHPAFYWGEASHFASPALAIDSVTGDDGESHGQVRAFGRTIDTTGFLGASRDDDGQLVARAVPAWATLPAILDLGMGRRWHFFFAWIFALNGLIYIGQGLLSGRFRRTLVPSLSEIKGIGHAIVEHAKLRFPQGEAARNYNVLQKLAYLSVVFGLLPLMVVTGLAMSPAMDARFHLLPEVFGGRQSARFVHFLSASGLVLFVVIHVLMVVLAGPFNELRSMVTGWFSIRTDGEQDKGAGA